MSKIAILGLRKNQQTAVSVLHDMEVLQLEPLSKDISAILKSERDNDLSRQVSDELLRVRALLTVLPSTKLSTKKRFDSVDEVLQIASTIDIDESVANFEKEKESLLTQIKDTENNLKLVEEFSFFPEDLKILKLTSATSYFGRIQSDKFEEFKKSIDAHKKDIMLYTKAEKKITHLILVVFTSISSDKFANIIQTHDVKMEVVPNLNGKPNKIKRRNISCRSCRESATSQIQIGIIITPIS